MMKCFIGLIMLILLILAISKAIVFSPALWIGIGAGVLIGVVKYGVKPKK